MNTSRWSIGLQHAFIHPHLVLSWVSCPENRRVGNETLISERKEEGKKKTWLSDFWPYCRKLWKNVTLLHKIYKVKKGKALDIFTNHWKSWKDASKTCNSQQVSSTGSAFQHILLQWQEQSNTPPALIWKQLLVWKQPFRGGNKQTSCTVWLMTTPMQICKQPNCCYLSLAKF